MGDSGSLFLGFTLSSIAILFATQPYDLVGFIAPFVVISVPILDTALAILRRLTRRAGLFSGDRQHVYDLLAKAGLGDRGAVLVMYLATALLGGLSASGHNYGDVFSRPILPTPSPPRGRGLG